MCVCVRTYVLGYTCACGDTDDVTDNIDGLILPYTPVPLRLLLCYLRTRPRDSPNSWLKSISGTEYLLI